MRSNFPKKKLIIFNFWLTTYFFLLGLVVSLANSGLEGIGKSLLNSSIGAFLLLLTAFTNLGLMLYFENRTLTSAVRQRQRYLFLSYGLSSLIYIIVVISLTIISHAEIKYNRLIFVVFICILINTLILALQHYIIIQEEKTVADIENSELKAANADAANQLLRQQIHPHFLFNALNILKSLYKINATQGEAYLIRLSDFLRAAVSHNNNKVTALKDEIKLCEDYLEMQRIRFGQALSYSIAITPKTLRSGMIPSFSIQPLVENAIKHNELTEESPLVISITEKGERIMVANNRKIKSTSETSTGSGLANLAERYRIICNDELMIEDTEKIFSVSIKILSHEDNNH